MGRAGSLRQRALGWKGRRGRPDGWPAPTAPPRSAKVLAAPKSRAKNRLSGDPAWTPGPGRPSEGHKGGWAEGGPTRAWSAHVPSAALPPPPVELHEPGTERGAWSPGPYPSPGSGVHSCPQGDTFDILAALALSPTWPGSHGVPGVLSPAEAWSHLVPCRKAW